MNRHLFINLLFLAWAYGSAAGQTLADAAADTLESIKETHYEHKTHVDKAAGVFDVDCSGFVDYLLKRIVPDRKMYGSRQIETFVAGRLPIL